MSLFHYTTIDGLTGILNKQQLWLTHFRYMNDYDELLHVIKRLKTSFLDAFDVLAKDAFIKENNTNDESLSNIEESLLNWRETDAYKNFFENHLKSSGVYIGSFCTRGNDILSQWRGYTSDVGYCIEFDEMVLNKSIIQLEEDQPGGAMVDCEYDPNKISKEIDVIRNGITSERENYLKMLTKAMSLCVKAKNHGFSEESERRIVFYKNGKFNEDQKFRIKSGILTPYHAIEFDKSAIKSVTIGPTHKQELASESISNFLKVKGYGNVQVKISEISLSS